MAGTFNLPAATNHTGATLSSAPELRDEPENVARQLLDPWLVPFYEFPSLWEELVKPIQGT
jgi:hypothetical protein